jgi:hypothetical protein
MISVLIPSENPGRKGGSPAYIVEGATMTALQCDCPDFIYRKGPKGESCKHMKLALELAMLGLGDGSSLEPAPEREMSEANVDLLFSSEDDYVAGMSL